MDEKDAWAPYAGLKVIVDTDSRFVYIGTLKQVLDHFLVLSEADVHDRREGPSTKEQYVMDTRKYGVKPNRAEVSIRKALVVSVSKLDDVITY